MDSMSEQHTPEAPRSWLLDRPLRGFALPTGRIGSLQGRLMGLLNGDEQDEASTLLAARPGEHVLEVGFGPGVLVQRTLAAGARVTGVDPSPQMAAQARRRNATAVSAGRADLRVGTAERTGLPGAAFDAVVSVNNVPMWSDLDAGMRELHRVLRPGGRAVVTWHGGARPRFVARRMLLADDVLDRIVTSMRAAFGAAELHRGDRLVAMLAHRASGEPD
ncbi:Methyltransferase domain-containing protein [Actinopolymorpha cephalotaxi]|uniref:Methyltransferase domain-containing protein n=2 Tax=Actinopolymorpha cephalotaxi TaxID=504797 RepID=A0A1I3B6H6_9ACTN|nr:Methyltransferase domain-containing protein [Actinopolymorpha cephalotaxi]